jgi:hypothetical protein
MFSHLVIGVEAGAFAKIGVDRDVAAKDGLKLRAKLADDGARAHDDSANEPERAGNFVSGQVEGGGDKAMIHGQEAAGNVVAGRKDFSLGEALLPSAGLAPVTAAFDFDLREGAGQGGLGRLQFLTLKSV